MKLRKAVPLAIMTSCAVLTSSGCDVFRERHPDFACPPPAAAGLAIAVGARANSPQPVVPSAVGTRIVAAMRDCRRITVIRVDGRPSVVGSLTFSTAAKTQQNLNIDQAAFLDKVKELIASVRARQPEANVLQALSVAAGAAGNRGTVVLIDSGVQTSDPLDFRKNDLTSRRPAAVVDALKQQHLLPDLSGRSLILAALGYTAAPQEALQDKNRAFLLDLWRGIVVAAGARSPEILEEPNTNASAVSSPPVSVVRFPTAAIHPLCDTLSVLPDSGEVGFATNKADFRNSTAASTVLGKLAGFLQQNPTRRVTESVAAARPAGGPLCSTRPPCVPAPGPTSINQSACLITSSSCSTTISELPADRSRSSTMSRVAVSSGCSPADGSSRT